jgi:TRAP-type C4-dicarboxylate transport system permease small subunit
VTVPPSDSLAFAWRLVKGLGSLERAICVVLMAGIVISMSIQILTRYLLGQPLVWVEEAAGYAFIWLVFLGAAAGFKELRHIRIDTFVARLPDVPQQLLRAALYAICTAAMLVVAYQAWEIMEVESRSSTMALPLELPRHLFYSVPLFVCTLSIAVTGVYLVVAHVVCAVSGRPVDAELEVAVRRALDEQLLNH